MDRQQHPEGGSVLLLVVAIAMGLAMWLASSGMQRAAEDKRQRQVGTSTELERLADIIANYSRSIERVPCPDLPSGTTVTGTDVAGDGMEDTVSATACQQVGLLPWRTLGLSERDANDQWGNRISYVAPQALTAAGALRDLVELNAGLTVCSTQPCGTNLINNPATSTGAGFVLISHGPSGFGAFTMSGIQKPLPTSPAEIANAVPTVAGTHYRLARSAVTVQPNAATHFDDVLAIRTAASLEVKSIDTSSGGGYTPPGGGAPADPNSNLSNGLTRDKIDAAMNGDLKKKKNTGQNELTLSGVGKIKASDGDQITVDKDVSWDSADEGIGASHGDSAASTTLDFGESLTFVLDNSYAKFAISFRGLTERSTGAETVFITAKRDGVAVGAMQLRSCTWNETVISNYNNRNFGTYSGGATRLFDELVIEPGESSAVYITSIQLCGENIASCTTSMGSVTCN